MTRIVPPPSSDPKTQDPRVVQNLYEGATDFYGTPIARSAGRRMLVGRPIWVDQPTYNSRGGSGSGPVVDAATNEIFISFAMAFGRSLVPSDELLSIQLVRLWFNDVLVIDRASTTGAAFNPHVSVKFYRGTSTQKPDKVIKADLGADKTPGFRDMIYAVFKDVPLHEFGTSVVPMVRAEFQDMTVDVSYVQQMSRLSASTDFGGTESTSFTATDWQRNRHYVFRTSGSHIGIGTYDLVNNAMIAFSTLTRDGSPVTDVSLSTVSVLPDSGRLLLAGLGGVCVVCDPLSGRVLGRKTTSSRLHSCAFPMRSVALDGSDNGVVWALANSRFAVSENTCQVFLYWDVGGETYRAKVGGGSTQTVNSLQAFFPAFSVDNDIVGMVGGELLSLDRLQGDPTLVGGGVFYIADTRSIYRVVVPYRPYKMSDDKIVVSGNEFQYLASPQIVVSKFWTTPSSSYLVRYIFFDASTEDVVVIYSHTGTGQRYMMRGKHPQHGSMVRNNTSSVASGTAVGDIDFEGVTIPSVGLGNVGWAHSDIQGGYLGVFASSSANILDLNDGSNVTFDDEDWRYVGDSSNQPLPLSFNQAGAPWSSGGGFMIGSVSGQWCKIYVGRAPEGTIALSDLLRWMLLAAGYEESQITITGIDDLVYGSIIQSQVTVIDLLNDMGQAFGFDWFESEGKIKIVRKGTGDSFAVDADVSSDDLAWTSAEDGFTINDDRALIITRNSSEDQPPNAIDLTYLNLRASYSVDIAHAKRTSFPVNAGGDGSVTKLFVPVVLSPAQAGAYAIKALYRIWSSQVEQEFRLSQRFAQIEPTDILSITRGAHEYTVKAVQTTYNGDHSVSVVAENYATDDAVEVDADDPLGLPQLLFMPSLCDFWWLDTPRLDYQVDKIGDGLLHYTAVTSRGQYGWTGGTLYQSTRDGFGMVYHNSEDALCAGVITNVPSVPGGGGVLQESETLELVVTVGSADDLEAATDLELRADANMAFWGAPGRWEIVQYGTITPSSTGASLGRIVRGRRGTEWAMSLHELGDRFIVATQAVRTINLSLDLLDEQITNRVIGDRLSVDTALTVRTDVGGNARKCYAPTDLSATLDGSDIDLAWKRRTRYLSELVDSVDDTPLDETSEEYEIDILDGPGGSVVRTFIGVTSPTKTYLSADLTADFGATPSVLTFVVYQIDDLVGRGFGAERTVDVL